MPSHPSPNIVSWFISLLKERKWYRWGVVFSSIILIISLIFPTYGVDNNVVQWYSVWAVIYFLIEWAQWGPSESGFTRSDHAGFLTLKIIIFMGFSYPFWSPWVRLINQSDIITSAGLFALIFFMSVSISLGVSINWATLYSMAGSKFFKHHQRAWIIISFAVSFPVFFIGMAMWYGACPFNFITLCVTFFLIGVFGSSIIQLGFVN